MTKLGPGEVGGLPRPSADKEVAQMTYDSGLPDGEVVGLGPTRGDVLERLDATRV